MFKFFPLSLLLVLLAFVNSPAMASPQASDVFQLTAAPRASVNGFSIIPPAGWSPANPGNQGFMTYLDQVKNNFRSNFFVHVSGDDGTPPPAVGAQMKSMFARQFEKWQLMGEGVTTLGGQQAYWLSSRFWLQGYDVQNLQYYLRGKNRQFYVLTFTALAGSYKAYEPLFRQTAMSVQMM